MINIDPNSEETANDLIDGWRKIEFKDYFEVKVEISLEESKGNKQWKHSFMAVSNEPKINSKTTVYDVSSAKEKTIKFKLRDCHIK